MKSVKARRVDVKSAQPSKPVYEVQNLDQVHTTYKRKKQQVVVGPPSLSELVSTKPSEYIEDLTKGE